MTITGTKKSTAGELPNIFVVPLLNNSKNSGLCPNFRGHGSGGSGGGGGGGHGRAVTGSRKRETDRLLEVALWAPLVLLVVSKPLGLDFAEALADFRDFCNSLSNRKKKKEPVSRAPLVGALAAMGAALFGWAM